MLALGVIVGLGNGLIITKLRVNAFIATLGTGLIIKGYMDDRYNGPAGSIGDSFQELGYRRFGIIPLSVILLAAVVVVIYLLLRYTRFGFRLYAVGGDEEVSRLSGVRTHRTIIAAHVVCSVCAVLTGLFLASRLGAGTPTVGQDGGYDLESIAAVVLGGTALAGGRGGVLGTIGGVFILAVLDNTFNQLEVNAFLKDVVRGVHHHRGRRRLRATDRVRTEGRGVSTDDRRPLRGAAEQPRGAAPQGADRHRADLHRPARRSSSGSRSSTRTSSSRRSSWRS